MNDASDAIIQGVTTVSISRKSVPDLFPDPLEPSTPPQAGTNTPGPAVQKQPRRSWLLRIRRRVRFHVLRILRLKSPAHAIALGVGLGIFVGCLPIIPLQTPVVLALALIFRANAPAAFASTFICNVFNMVPFYSLLYLIGRTVLPTAPLDFDPTRLSMTELMTQGWSIFLVMCTGGVMLGLPWGFGAYWVTRRGVVAYRQRRARQLQGRNADTA